MPTWLPSAVLIDIEQRLKRGGKYEMATLELREGDAISTTTARRLTRAALAVNKTIGDPTRVAGSKRSSARKKARRTSSVAGA
jgi:hypothetical protein